MYGATLPVAGLLCLAVGFLFGLPALRLEGLYLALATFALALAVAVGFDHLRGGGVRVVVSAGTVNEKPENSSSA